MTWIPFLFVVAGTAGESGFGQVWPVHLTAEARSKVPDQPLAAVGVGAMVCGTNWIAGFYIEGIGDRPTVPTYIQFETAKGRQLLKVDPSHIVTEASWIGNRFPAGRKGSPETSHHIANSIQLSPDVESIWPQGLVLREGTRGWGGMGVPGGATWTGEFPLEWRVLFLGPGPKCSIN